MARLVYPFPFPLGGEGLTGGKPWITNLVPPADAQEVSLLRPVCLSFRDAETFIDPAQMLIEVGYAKAYAFATSLDSFAKIPNTKRISLQPGIISGDVDISLVSNGLLIAKTANDPQRGCYATPVTALPGYSSAMVSAVIFPGELSSSETLSAGPLNPTIYPGPLMPLPYSTLEVASTTGSVLGLEHGPRNKVIYLFLCVVGGVKYLQLVSYRVSSGAPGISLTTPYNWRAGLQRYTLVWNEAYGYVEVYADYLGVTNRVLRVPISAIPDMPAGYFARTSKPSEIVGIYGQEGQQGDSSIWKSIAITGDVGYPILGNIRPGTFKTTVAGSELLKIRGDQDPRTLDVGCWANAPEALFPSADPSATVFSAEGVLNMAKPTLDKTFVFYREEPGLLRSNTDGFMIEVRMKAKPTKQDSASTGTGFVVYDGRTYFQVTLFDDFATKSVGVLKRLGNESDLAYHFLPTTSIDWSETGFRFIVDPRYKRIKMYALSDLTTACMDIPFDRAVLPSSADRGLAGKTPFVAFGHTTETPTTGTLELEELTVCHLYQEWESRSGFLPSYVTPPGDPSKVDPSFSVDTVGSPSAAIVDGVCRIVAPPDTALRFHRAVPFSLNRGGVVEAGLKIPSYKLRSRTGVYLIIDDGNTAYSLTFVETAVGRFVALSLRDALTGFKEIVGRDGQGTQLSFVCDWTKFHTYRIEKRPYNGVHVFLDNETSARIFYPEATVSQLPDEQFAGVPSIGFGHFTGDSAVSEWSFVRGFFSGGFEISFKKNKTDRVLRQELFGTQAIVVAYVEDED